MKQQNNRSFIKTLSGDLHKKIKYTELKEERKKGREVDQTICCVCCCNQVVLVVRLVTSVSSSIYCRAVAGSPWVRPSGKTGFLTAVLVLSRDATINASVGILLIYLQFFKQLTGFIIVLLVTILMKLCLFSIFTSILGLPRTSRRPWASGARRITCRYKIVFWFDIKYTIF